MTKKIEIEVTQVYTKTMKASIDVPENLSVRGIHDYVNDMDIMNAKIVTEEEFNSPYKVISAPTIYYTDTKTNQGGYIQLNKKDEDIRK
jgi:hypothetical protein